MTKEGDYSFKVRTVPHTEEEKKRGKKSEWTKQETYISLRMRFLTAPDRRTATAVLPAEEIRTLDGARKATHGI